MEVGVPKCGLVVVGDGDGTVREQLRVAALRIGETPIPLLDEYDYLGVRIIGAEFPSLRRHIEVRAEKFDKRMVRLQPYLTTKSIPLQTRLIVFKVVALPVMRWGAEALGPAEAELAPMAKRYGEAVRSLLGTVGSRNVAFCTRSVCRELGLTSWHELVIRARARLFFKAGTLRTFIRVLAAEQQPGRGRGAWFRRTKNWLTRYARVADGDCLADVETKILAYFRAQDRRHSTLSYDRYEGARFEDTRLYIQVALRYVSLAMGVNWLARARVNGIWTARKAVQAGLIAQTHADRCPACGTAIAATPELLHVLLACPNYAPQRLLLEPLLSADPLSLLTDLELFFFLLGGRAAGSNVAMPGAQWSGVDDETFADLGVPAFLPVCRFLQAVMPEHMRLLWSHSL